MPFCNVPTWVHRCRACGAQFWSATATAPVHCAKCCSHQGFHTTRDSEEQDSEEQHAAWKREAAAVEVERLREVVDRRMWRHEAENDAARRFGLSIQAAIYLVGRALELGVIGDEFGHVSPKPEA
jgi:predicted  nucleic acid-binding Zn-ribbon protein